jgi:photosystem II stability/assembly factor-like uncharacterized protein
MQRLAPIVDACSVTKGIWIVTAKGELRSLHSEGSGNFTVAELPRVQRVDFLNDREGWTVDVNNSLWSTHDSGSSWQKIGRFDSSDKTAPSFAVNQIAFVDQRIGWIVDSTYVWYTEDGGKNWAKVYPTPTANYESLNAQPLRISPVGNGAAWLGMTNGKILRKNNSELHWQEASLDMESDIKSIHAFSENECIVSVIGGVFSTADGGGNWHKNVSYQSEGYLVATSISFLTRDLGWLAASKVDPDLKLPLTSAIFRTTDGGRNWNEINQNLPAREDIRYLHFADEMNGWACTSKTVYSTSTGGTHWIKIKDFD